MTETTKAVAKPKMTTRDICEIGLFTAILIIMAQLSIPMPAGVPMTMQTFAITLIAVVLGAKKGFLSVLIYLILGAVGVPVLAGFTGGLQYFVGPTGGFLISFPIMALVIGIGAELRKKSNVLFLVCLIAGTVINYIVGVLMFVVVAHSTIPIAVAACVIPFIPTAVIKMILATLLGFTVRKQMARIR